MSLNKLFADLKKNFALKERHILILKTLQRHGSTAPDICKATGILHGRIYDLLNELLSFGLIEKGEKKPTIYSIGSMSDNVLEYIRHKFSDFIGKQKEIVYDLEKIEAKERIELINSKKDLTLNLINFFSESRSAKSKEIYLIGRHLSIPFIIYPFERAKFIKLRSLIAKKRPIIGHPNVSYSMRVCMACHELYNAGKVFNLIVEKESLDYHIELIKTNLGNKFLKSMLSELMRRIKSKRINAYVLDEYLATGADITHNRVLLSLIHRGLATGIDIRSAKIAEVYITLFEDMAERSVSLASYLKSRNFINQKIS